MKYAVLVVFILFFNCKNEEKIELKVEDSSTVVAKKQEYVSFGEQIASDNAKEASVMLETFQGLKPGDTLNSKVSAKVLDVCQAKGCWMILDLGDDKTTRVKFKDYGFFMPKDIKGKEVIVNGKAFVNVMPVEELRHYAEDAGKTEAEVAAIVTPEKTFSFLANGVLLKE